MTDNSDDTIPLWLFHDDEFEHWCETRDARVGSWARAQHFKAEKHRVLMVPDSNGNIELAIGGLGKRGATPSLWIAAGLIDRLPPRRYRLAQAFGDAEATQLGLGFLYGAYRFDRYRPSKARADGCAVVEPCDNADARFVAAAARSLKLARDWINTPAADLGPAELSEAARHLAKAHGARFREWVGGELLEANFPAIHAVGRASTAAPRLAQLEWEPTREEDHARTMSTIPGTEWPLLVLIGKGVCFDSGGLDIKSSSSMALMKKDMGGAAVVLGLANLCMQMNLRVRLLVLIPAVENAISGCAFRPGDVLATRKGLTVEVGNTDAEGRLILGDALALADALHPDLIIDFATLTGAARVALGPELPALFGTQPRTVEELTRIAAEEHDPLWPMPLWAPYDDELNSKIADMNNVAASGLAGAIFGALYLKRFVTESPDWLHLDLYGWNPKERPGRAVGAEAQALRGVYRYLVTRYGLVAAP